MIEKVNEVLYSVWNPIGVADLPEDEYLSYAKKILEKYSNNNSAVDIAEYLLYIEDNVLLCSSKNMILSAERISKILE
jgi:hypothetical protein